MLVSSLPDTPWSVSSCHCSYTWATAGWSAIKSKSVRSQKASSIMPMTDTCLSAGMSSSVNSASMAWAAWASYPGGGAGNMSRMLYKKGYRQPFDTKTSTSDQGLIYSELSVA